MKIEEFFKNFKNKYQITNSFYSINYNLITRKFPRIIVVILDSVIILIFRLLPVSVLKALSPKFIHPFLFSILLELNLKKSQRIHLLGDYTNEISDLDSQRIYHHKIQYRFISYFINGLSALEDLKIRELVKFLVNDENLNENNLYKYDRNWHIFRVICNFAHFNLSHKDLVKFFNQIVKYLDSYSSANKSNSRILLHYASNMGHLGFLFLYLNHYQRLESKSRRRKIDLLTSEVANHYFLNILIRSSKISIRQINDVKKLRHSVISEVDTLHISRDSQGNFRLNDPLFSFQKKPTYRNLNGLTPKKCKSQFYRINSQFTLSLTLEEYKLGLKQINLAIPLSKLDWFVILHLKGNKFGFTRHSEARESNISNYIEFANYITDLGGIVIRMGDKSFPKLSKSIQMYDYAHSNIKSDFLDCWLWSQCRWWTGNMNGASVAPHAFNKPRLVTDQWYWEIIGKKTDLVLPKLAKKDKKIMSIRDVFNSRVSRTINSAMLSAYNLELIENSPLDILNGAKDMLNLLDYGTLEENSKVNKEMIKYFGAGYPDVMTVAPSFARRWEKELLN